MIQLEGGEIMLYKLTRYTTAILFGIMGYAASYSFGPVIVELLKESFTTVEFFNTVVAEILLTVTMAAFGFLVGWFLSNPIIRLGMNITKNLERFLTRFSGQDLLFGAIGLAFGLIISNLIGLSFRGIPLVGPYMPVILSAILGYLGMHLMIHKRKDIMEYWQSKQILPLGFHLTEDEHKKTLDTLCEKHKGSEATIDAKLLDTSVVIDGRIADICHTGFLEGRLMVPLFVLEELQKISDSSDTLKRNKGRRGLDILQEMQDDPTIDIDVIDTNYDDITEVDSKLMRLALEKNWKIITNDFNLNKVATLQGISVLNLNDLANAMKPVRIPGETMVVQIVKEGKENGQGIAYLEDGTMIVVEKGTAYINQTIPVVVTSILQTRAGRMIFAKPEGEN